MVAELLLPPPSGVERKQEERKREEGNEEKRKHKGVSIVDAQISVHASGAGSSIVCSQEGLMISSVMESPTVNCCSPSLLSPPY